MTKADQIESAFIECDTCRAKPGTPILCVGCLANRATIAKLLTVIEETREALTGIVCTVQPDAGVVLLSQEGPTHLEEWNGKPVSVYDHEYFSPLGDALISLYLKTGGEIK